MESKQHPSSRKIRHNKQTCIVAPFVYPNLMARNDRSSLYCIVQLVWKAAILVDVVDACAQMLSEHISCSKTCCERTTARKNAPFNMPPEISWPRSTGNAEVFSISQTPTNFHSGIFKLEVF